MLLLLGVFGAANFPGLREKAEQYFESATTGDPAFGAYMMVTYFGSKREWAQEVIESAKTGDPACAAYLMVADCGSKKEWAAKVKHK